MLQIFSRSKDLNDPVLGSPRLNRVGLHQTRVRLAAVCAKRRRTRLGKPYDHLQARLDRDGVLMIESFLPDEAYQAVSAEAEQAQKQASANNPPTPGQGKWFGSKQRHPWGFDRYDGGTLNRFVNIDPERHPNADQFRGGQSIAQLASALVGGALNPAHAWFYLTKNGDQQAFPDPQKGFHRDTFFSSLKYWYFLRPVDRENGPFEYYRGSHRLTPERLAWEHDQALKAMAKPRGSRGSSFRISEEDTKALGLNSPTSLTAPANTLVMADTFGFHRRGDAQEGTERLAIYGNLRPWPLRFTQAQPR